MDSDHKNKLQKAVDYFREELKTLKTGRANSALVEHLDVQAYGSTMKLSAVASINSQDSRTLVISPWDKTIVKDIETAIKNSDLGINPNVDGEIIRLSFPPLTEERRKELIKVLGNLTENAKVAIRNLRREFITEIEKDKKEGGVSESDQKMAINGVETTIKDFIQQIDSLSESKEKELNTI